MGASRLAAVLVIAGACGDDPRLQLSVTHPTDPRLHDAIAHTVVTVYQSPTLTCTQVEFGDVDAQQLDALAVAQVTIDPPDRTGDLDAVSRLDHKVIVARGFDDTGVLLTIGCTEVDDVALAIATIDTVPAATISVGVNDDLTGLLVATTDAFSRPLNQRAVTWRVYGPAGTSADPSKYTNVEDGVWEPKQPSCTRDGEVTLHPAPPQVPAGYAIRARISWAANAPALATRFTGFDREASAVAIAELDPSVEGTDSRIVQRCAIQRTGARSSIVCLESPTSAVKFDLSGGALGPPQRQPVPISVAVVATPRGAGDDTAAYVIGPFGNWTALYGAPAPVTGTSPWCHGSCPPDGEAAEVQVVPACGDEPGGVVTRLTDGTFSRLEIAAIDGSPVTARPAVTNNPITNAGCLTELQPDGTPVVRQGVVFGLSTDEAARAFISFTCAIFSDRSCQALVNQGAGFVPGEEPHLVIATFDAAGTSLSTVVAQPNGSMMRDRFIERFRQPAAQLPTQLIAGNFDGDGEPDLFWYFTPMLASGTNIQIAYGRKVDGVPLTALGNLPAASLVDVFAADLNGDGLDELVGLLETPGVVSGTRLELFVVRNSAPLPSTAPLDSPCP